MHDAARARSEGAAAETPAKLALDDLSDHLGQVLHHADELLTDWSRFGAEVRSQVEGEAGAIGAAVERAVARAADASLDRAVADRLSALTVEIGKLEQRARAASRTVAQQQQSDRRVLWILATGVMLANVLLVVLWLRTPPAPVVVPEPVRVDRVERAAPVTSPAPDAMSAADARPAPSQDLPSASRPAAPAAKPGATVPAKPGAAIPAKPGAAPKKSP